MQGKFGFGFGRFSISILGCLLVYSAFAAQPGAPSNLRIGDAPRKGIYVGVPAPNGKVPAAIMPNLPTATEQIDAFPYDPINMVTPTWNDDPGQYYVDNSATCDDTNNGGRGSPLAPRCTIPGLELRFRWTLEAGDQVFIVGNGQSYTPARDATVDRVDMRGTATEPVWIIGVSNPSNPRWINQPKLDFEFLGLGDATMMTHVVFDNVHFLNPDFRSSFVTNSDMTNRFEYFTVRHSTCSPTEDAHAAGVESTKSRRCFSFVGAIENPVRFVMLYDNDIFGRGHWPGDLNINTDIHGVQPQRATYYFWYIANRSFHLQGDSIQCSNSNQKNLIFEQRPHYIYVAGNEFYENYENAWDSKGCYHVVFSENYIHDFYNETKKANNSAIIAPNDDESYIGSNFEWYINNRIERVGNAFSYKGTSEDAFVYFMGNFGVDIEYDVFPIESRCLNNSVPTCADGMYAAQNTFDCGLKAAVVKATRNGSIDPNIVPIEEQNQLINFSGNIFYNCIDAANAQVPSPIGFEGINANWIVTYEYNVDYRITGDLALSKFNDIEVGNRTNIDPKFVNANGHLTGDYSLGPLSTVKRLVPVEATPYAQFRSMYGLDIREDINGKVWRSGAVLNPGAFQ
jgi:hypothetical protein